MEVIIIGAGLGGLALANGLRQPSFHVNVFERQGSPEENLAGFGLHLDAKGKASLKYCLPPASYDAFEEESTIAGSQLRFLDSNLTLLAERDDALLSQQSFSAAERRGIGRIELRRILLRSLPEGVVHWSKEFKRYEELETGKVRVHFVDGTSEEGDLVVGADGAHSPVRQQLLPQLGREDLGIMAIAGRYILGTSASIESFPRSFLDGTLNNIVPHGEGWMFLSTWTACVSPNSGPQKSLVWAYIVPKAQTPSNIKSLGALDLQNLALNGVREWSHAFTHMIQHTDTSTLTPICLRSASHLDPWQPCRITVLGDSIHSMPPTAGIGANTALRDAAELLRALQSVCSTVLEATNETPPAESIKEAVWRYESNMRRYANEAVAISRRNAKGAASNNLFGRQVFRLMLRLAGISPAVMRATIGKAVIKAS